jgi:4'-phosphopantetheinyl transferase
VLVGPRAFSQIWAAVAPQLQRLEQHPAGQRLEQQQQQQQQQQLEQQQTAATGVMLWLLPLADLPFDAAWLALLSEAEQQRAQAYANAALGQDFIARRVVLRLLLAQVLQQPLGEIVLSSTASGQLYLEHSHWQLSLSYSGRVVLYGLAQRPIGVDIEQMRPPKALARISERYFPGEEIANEHDFFAAWTRFEARAKAAGQGIAAYTTMPGPSRDWPCENIKTLAGFAAAICWQP